jgi:peptidoglycan-N-acetylglucosamine deacetylase
MLIQWFWLMLFPFIFWTNLNWPKTLEHGNLIEPAMMIQLYKETVTHGPRNRNKIALTFDADMSSGMVTMLKTGQIKSWYDKRIIDLLRKNQIKATIFMTGLWAETYPKEAKELTNDPLFEVENHSYSHPAFTPACYALEIISVKDHEEEFAKSQKVIGEITGKTPKYFRFPGGCGYQKDVDLLKKYNLSVIGWDVVSGDAFNNDTQSLINSVSQSVQNGSIILFHLHGGPNAPKTFDALTKILPIIKEKKLVPVKLDELLAE